jgi:pSer/pThr/pTyr-binding forkhead associated (FHA) protein
MASTGPSPARPQRPGGVTKLLVSAGPAKGKEFILDGPEISVGRTGDNLIGIPDPSVSRKQFVLRRQSGVWRIEDLGSGSGTYLNGERTQGSMPLTHGDLITCGGTELTFLDPERAPR